MVNIRLLSFSFAVLGAAGSSLAQTWDGGASSSAWGTGLNWSGNSVPASGATVTFDAFVANAQYTVALGGNRTVAGIVFVSATGTNRFTFNSNTLLVGSGGIINNDAETQIFNSAFSLSASQTWNAASGGFTFAGNVGIGGNILTLDGSGSSTISGRITGTGSLVKNGSGTVVLTDNSNSYQGLTVNAGTLRITSGGGISIASDGSNDHLGQGDISINGGVLDIVPGGNFTGFRREFTINGGRVRVDPDGSITDLIGGSGLMIFGSAGGTLELASPLSGGMDLGATQVNASSATPGVIEYGFIAHTSTPFGWATGQRELGIADGDLTGAGLLKLSLTGGAQVRYEQASFGGSLLYSGVSGGSASAGSASTSVGRLLFNSSSTVGVTGGLFFENAMQVTTTAARTIDNNITINSGTTAFQGRSKSSGAAEDLTLGLTVGGYTLTVKDGATAAMDIRFRDEGSLNFVGGVTLNANTVLEAGGTLSFTKSATVGGETVDAISVNGDITGQGTVAQESTVNLAIGSGTGGANFATGAGTAGSDLIVNGTGTGGLRIQGTKARVDNLLTTERLQDLTGTGGTLTIAYSDSSAGTFSVAPLTGSNVSLGFDAQGGSAPTYNLGATADDLANWGGLVVKGGTVVTMFNESFTGSGGVTTALNLLGGTLILNDGSNARTLTFEGGANLTAGTLNGGTSAGTLVIGGDLTHGTATLVNSPNITMNNSGANVISGSAITGIGTLAKSGAGTVTVNTSVTANTIDIQTGTLLLGSNNTVGDSTAVRLSGGTLATGGNTETVGVLTLASSSIIDFGSGTSILNFANSSGATWSGGTLYIANWSGSWTGGGTDQLIFGSTIGGLSAGQVSQIAFWNPNGIVGQFNAQILASGEIVPVPEPATIGFGALLLGSLGFRERERVARWVRALASKFASA